MSARITIQSGIAAGTSHRIENRVARVGSDPQNDICLPTANVPGHALTLEFRDDGCRVYNRCRDSVYIGTHVVASDEVADWPDTDILQMADDIELLLDFEDEETAYVHDEVYDAPADLSPAVETVVGKTKPSGSSKTVIQLSVTALCVVGSVLLLIRDANKDKPAADTPVFSTIVTDAMAAGSSTELIQRLQYAESLRVRGDNERATIRFGRLRDDLLAQREQLTAEARKPEFQILQLVESRLAELD